MRIMNTNTTQLKETWTSIWKKPIFKSFSVKRELEKEKASQNYFPHGSLHYESKCKDNEVKSIIIDAKSNTENHQFHDHRRKQNHKTNKKSNEPV